jgi:pSer/pThr/pTyr-binding forkhead associated (FHA) protein
MLKVAADRQAALKAEQDRQAAEQARDSEAIGDTARRQAVSTARLLVQRGPNAGQSFALQTGVNIIGRMSGAAIRLTDVLISRQHVRLNLESKRVTLEDLGSANGTFVNAQKISGTAPVVLRDGDTIAVGDTVLVFQMKVAAPIEQSAEPHGEQAAVEQTLIAEAPLPNSFADQLVADQSTRLTSAVSAQPLSDSQRILQLIARPTLIVAVGFGVIFGLWFGLLMNVQDSVSVLVLTVAAIALMWTAVGLILRQMQVIVSWRRIFAVGAGWAMAAGLGTGVAYALGNALFYSRSPDFLSLLFLLIILSAVCGLVGGQLTGRILHSHLPALRLKTTTWGWTIAWIVGGCAFMLLGWDKGSETAGQMLGLSGALIGAIGGGTMFWQIAQRRDSDATLRPESTVIKPQTAPKSSVAVELDLSSQVVRAIAIICGGWIALELLTVLVGQIASSAEETATLLCLGLGVGSLGVGYVLQRAIPSMRRAAGWQAAIWSAALIGAIQIGIVVQIDSNVLSAAAVGVCGVVSAWVVLRDMPGVPRWQYGVIGVIWMLTYAVGSGYAWHMVVYKAQHNGWSLAETMNALDLSVLSLILGAILSAAAGGVALYLLTDRARKLK